MTTSSSEREKRQRSEQKFFDELYRDGWEKQHNIIDLSFVPANMLVYWDLVKVHVEGLSTNREEDICVLDCGCGYGILSILLARLGAHVTATDISPNCIKILQRVARSNGLEDRISPRVGALESLDFPDATFDCVVGTRILHHVDVAAAGHQIARVLKGAGKAFFWECTEKNPILRFLRNDLHRTLPLPKFGTQHEHPLTRVEIETMASYFGRPPEIVPAPFYFFHLADEYIFSQKAGWMSRLLKGTDAAIAKYLPFLNHFSFHQVLVFEKMVQEGNTGVVARLHCQ